MAKQASELTKVTIRYVCIIVSFALNAIVFWMHDVPVMFGVCIVMIVASIALYSSIVRSILHNGYEEDRG